MTSSNLLSLPCEILAHILTFVDNSSLASLTFVNATMAALVSQGLQSRENLLTSLIVAENDSNNPAILARATQKPALQLGVPASAIYKRTDSLLPQEPMPALAKVYSVKNLFFLLSQVKERQRKAIDSIVDECQFRRCIRDNDPVTARPSCFMKHPNGAMRIYSLPTMEQVIQLEQRLSISLPMDYVHFLLNHSHKLHHFLSFSREAKCEGVQITELGNLDYIKTTKTIESMSIYQPSVLLAQGRPRRFLCVYSSRNAGYKIYLDVTDPLHHSFGCVYSTWDSELNNPIPTWVDHSFTDLLARMSATIKESPIKSPSKVNARILTEPPKVISAFRQETHVRGIFQ
ncbi:hypothetical protein K493DRAFT_341210 [Basidiobolus meristosporus CBS 931.73]|uniref:F-box domain-containing protein n=1 Tax=Basidiobolus meristosporus CBS 931.73 TaxID=1314790 RepID=A0A1Y1XSA9_9FUNG|nr:hypothetical protein K493DRAFT_341210 [Basidiobolus meristosporus CBS 931.73]|eukprot:ORX88565.1 hypothetical protein K493DRAFT_341210 [Basidiobolus meristosporus CBS 931.73]